MISLSNVTYCCELSALQHHPHRQRRDDHTDEANFSAHGRDTLSSALISGNIVIWYYLFLSSPRTKTTTAMTYELERPRCLQGCLEHRSHKQSRDGCVTTSPASSRGLPVSDRSKRTSCEVFRRETRLGSRTMSIGIT